MNNIVLEEAQNVLKGKASLLSKIKDNNESYNSATEIGLINKKTGASILNREDKSIGMASGTMSQYRTAAIENKGIEQTIESELIAVRRKLDVDEIVINNHKLNPALYELTDMKEKGDVAIGNLTMYATVLVKTWEPTLKKWVLMRRIARVPAFSNITNLPIVPKQLGIDTNISEEILKISKRGEKE